MNKRKWLKIWFVSVITMTLTVVIINFSMDPLWFFSFSHRCNNLQTGFDERFQKSVKLKYTINLNNVDTLLMGSSRSTYYDQTKFGNMKVFNYAFSNAYPIEYSYFIDYAKKLKGSDFKNIILGLDFFGYGKQKGKSHTLEYLNDYKQDWGYVLSKYVTFDALKYSLTNVVFSLTNHAGGRSYNRNNIVLCDKKDRKKVKQKAEAKSKIYWKNMTYNENYMNILTELKKENAKSNFIVYTTPLSKPFLQVLYKNKILKEYYFHWIQEMVEVFGKVYFFTMPSELSENYQDYSKDGDHFYPEMVENISNIISGQKDIDGFGVIITQENLTQILEEFKKQVSSYDLKSLQDHKTDIQKL